MVTAGQSPSTGAGRLATWEKPGPGSWSLDASHCGPAPGPVLRDLYQRCTGLGFAEGFSWFGAPLAGMEVRWVNGKYYRRVVPLGPDKDGPPPPRWLLRLLTRLHPEFRRQERRAAESFAIRRWREDLQRWEEDWKPSIIDANLSFTRIDVAALADGELARHLEEVHEHLQRTSILHFRLHVTDMGPLGDLMVHLQDWGLDPQATFSALGAASPATRDPAGRLRHLAELLRAAGRDPATIASLEEVRATSAEAAAALEEYLDAHGWRLTTGYDLEDHCLIELPQVIVAALRAAASEHLVDDETHQRLAAEQLASLRERVPPEHLDELDELVADARASYGMRDENGPLTYEWPAGLLRRGLLEAARRLADRGRLARREDIFELSLAEVAGLLRDGQGPDLDEIAQRAGERRWWAGLEAPLHLGPEEQPPPVEAMPPALGRVTRIVTTVLSHIEADGEVASPGMAEHEASGASGGGVSGTGIGTVTYRGTARVVHDATEALVLMQPGDVLVAPYTAPTYNAVLSMAGAIVTEEGGLLCHAAVIARELGIPAVVGARGAMSTISDGAQVEVDPSAGAVRALG